MRPGKAEDLPLLLELWRAEVAAGRQDMLPNERTLRRLLAHFDWEARSRVVEDGSRIAGSVLVMSRPAPDGVITNVYAAGSPEIFHNLVGWGVGLSRAAGASVAQVFVGKGLGGGLERAGLGLELVRPWWRMDRTLARLPEVASVAGYELTDATTVPAGSWEKMFNYGDDPRPQPVGLVSSVGTLPEHRRRGLATWLVTEMLRRLRTAGARSASLYVDGASQMKAYDVYRKIGFEVAREAEVWEATFS